MFGEIKVICYHFNLFVISITYISRCHRILNHFNFCSTNKFQT